MLRDDRDVHFRVVILDSVESLKARKAGPSTFSLSRLALAAMLKLTGSGSHETPPPPTTPRLFRRMSDLLERGSSMALGQVKSMLEYVLWGPVSFDFSTSGGAGKREEELQRWVDLERATVLNKVIRTQGLLLASNVDLAVYEEYHLLFLVQTCAKMLHEASLLFQSTEVACM